MIVGVVRQGPAFGGLLTTRFVWVEGAVGPTRYWSWEIEGTWWLRWCFDGIEEGDPAAAPPPMDERITGPLFWTPLPPTSASKPYAASDGWPPGGLLRGS